MLSRWRLWQALRVYSSLRPLRCDPDAPMPLDCPVLPDVLEYEPDWPD